MEVLQLLLITLTCLVADASKNTLQTNFENLMKQKSQYQPIADLFVGTTMFKRKSKRIYKAFVNEDNLGRQVEVGEKLVLEKESMIKTSEIKKRHIDGEGDIYLAAISTDEKNEKTKIEIVENRQVEFDSDGDSWSMFTAVLEMNGLFPQIIEYRGGKFFFQQIKSYSRWHDIFIFKYIQKRDDLLHKSLEVEVNAEDPTNISKISYSNNKWEGIFSDVEKTEITDPLKLLYPVAIAGSDILRGAYKFCPKNEKEFIKILQFYLKRPQKYYFNQKSRPIPMITIEQNPKPEEDAKKVLQDLVGKNFDFYIWCMLQGHNTNPFTPEQAKRLYAKFENSQN